jgi:hypothetical protein
VFDGKVLTIIYSSAQGDGKQKINRNQVTTSLGKELPVKSCTKGEKTALFNASNCIQTARYGRN